jgi:probable rRNA maturation factor
MNAVVDIVVEAGDWSGIPDLEKRVERAALAALARADVNLRQGAELAVLLTDDAALAELNRRWRGKDGPTNVLSFPAAPLHGLADSPMLGDLALAYETCAREAGSQGKSLADHLSHLVVHGTLHLVGHDHETETEAEAMEALERSVLAGLGIADPYAETQEMTS